jgi:hypothetical protein
MTEADLFDYRVAQFNISNGRCFTGAKDMYNCYDTVYKFVCILDHREEFLFCCTTIPEITEWCLENNCIYGWARIISTMDHLMVGNGKDDFKLFIAAKTRENYALAKLTWLRYDS